MRYIKRYNESESFDFFDTKGWSKYVPKNLTVVTHNGNWNLKLPDSDSDLGHPTNITHLMNCIQFDYHHSSAEKSNVLKDGEPDHLAFDIWIVKNNDGHSANPSTLKLDVDITYGDSMVVQFSIEKLKDGSDKVQISHYNGYGSKYEPDTYFGFDDESLDKLVYFFNTWGFNITKDDLKFLDKYPDTYVDVKTNETIKLNPLFGDGFILVVNNSQPQENRYLKNLVKYLELRALPFKVASAPDEIETLNSQEKILGSILTGSNYRLLEENPKHELNKKAIEVLSCPIFAIGFGMQSLAKLCNGDIQSCDKPIFGSYKLSDYQTHDLFKDVDFDTTQFSFSLNDVINQPPNEFETIGKLDDKVVAFANDEKKHYGTLFHPEDIEHSYVVLDNFIGMCDGNRQKETEDLKGELKMTNVIESYEQFVSRVSNKLP